MSTTKARNTARARLSAIGLETDAHEFRAVQLVRTPRGIGALAWAIFPRQDAATLESSEESLRLGRYPGSEELAWAASILGRRGFVGNTFSIAPSTADCSSHVIELPPKSSGAPISQLARMEVARARRCAPNDFEIGYWELPAKGRSVESLAVACSRKVIDDTMDRFHGAGLTPAGIDLMELAIYRGAQGETPEVENEINTSLHIGWTSSLAVLTLGESVIYVRRIERGASSVWELARGKYRLAERGADAIVDDRIEHADPELFASIRRSTWSGLAAELAGEIDVAIAYVSHSFRTAPLGRLRLSGYGTHNTIIEERFDHVLGIPIEYACPRALLDSIDAGEHRDRIAGRLSAAYGLAARFDR